MGDDRQSPLLFTNARAPGYRQSPAMSYSKEMIYLMREVRLFDIDDFAFTGNDDVLLNSRRRSRHGRARDLPGRQSVDMPVLTLGLGDAFSAY